MGNSHTNVAYVIFTFQRSGTYENKIRKTSYPVYEKNLVFFTCMYVIFNFNIDN